MADTGRTRRELALARPLTRRLALPVGASVLFNVMLAVGDRLPAVDGLAYFEAGRNLLGGHGYTRAGGPELHFPPLVPVCLRVLELITGSEMAALGTWNVLSALAVLAALAGLAHRLWHDDGVTVAVAWFGGTMAGLGPLFFHHGSGSEAISLALLLAAVLAALRAVDDRHHPIRSGVEAANGAARRVVGVPLAQFGWLGASGLLVGLAYLARPEALLSGVLVVVAVAAWSWRKRRGLRGMRPAVGLACVFLAGMTVLVAPYVAYLHEHTGSWSLTAKSQDVSIEAWRAVAEGHRRERDQYVYALEPDGTLGTESRPLTALAAENPRAWLGIVGVNAGTIARVYLAPLWGYGPAWSLVPAPLLVPALVELWRLRRQRGVWLLVGVAVVPLLTCLAFFTLPRYLVVPTAVLTLFAAKGVVRWQRSLAGRWAPTLVVAVVLLVALSSLTEARSFLPGGRTADPVDQQAVGEWLADHTPEGARVMTRSFHVQAYAHRPIVAMPVADYAATMRFARQMGVSYIVLDARSPLYARLSVGPPPPGLRALAAVGTAKRPMRVYQLDPAPPPSDRDPIPLGYVGD